MKTRMRITFEVDTNKPRNDINLWAVTTAKNLIDSELGEEVVYLATEIVPNQNTRQREIIKDKT